MEGKIGLTEILLILAENGVGADRSQRLVADGPGKFAALGKGLGESIRNFKSAMKEDGQKKEEEDKKS